ncbi:MAG: GNAT family N-acetyltransferase [Crocinitomicaceae bacterium]|nr:GNAT family N-acetyltransferase [Crocinitomicaceae bacterium]
MEYRDEREDGIVIVHSAPEYCEQIEELAKVVFPTIADEDCLKYEHYLSHTTVFREGQYIALDGDRVIGVTGTFRDNFDFSKPQHNFHDYTDEGLIVKAHVPDGDWLYGIDLAVHPDYRKRGIARSLYAGREATVDHLNLKGQITVGMMSGYGKVKQEMTGDEYYHKVISGEIYDPTVSTQMRIGWEIEALIPDYLDEPEVTGNYGILLVLKKGNFKG